MTGVLYTIPYIMTGVLYIIPYILHGSTTDCTAVVSARGYRRLLTVERGRINGGKFVLSLSYVCNCRIIDSSIYYRLLLLLVLVF